MIIMMSTWQGSKWAARRSLCERPLYDDYDDYSNYDDYHGCDVKHDFDDYHDYDYDDYVTGKQVGSKEELVWETAHLRQVLSEDSWQLPGWFG